MPATKKKSTKKAAVQAAVAPETMPVEKMSALVWKGDQPDDSISGKALGILNGTVTSYVVLDVKGKGNVAVPLTTVLRELLEELAGIRGVNITITYKGTKGRTKIYSLVANGDEVIRPFTFDLNKLAETV